jgi:hypothetical protein
MHDRNQLGSIRVAIPFVKEAVTPGGSVRLGQRLVRAIAEWRVCSVFALTPPEGLLFGDFELHRLQAGAFVRAITERWMAGSPTGTPPMRACLHLQGEWFGITDDGFLGHKLKMTKAFLFRDGSLGKLKVGLLRLFHLGSLAMFL